MSIIYLRKALPSLPSCRSCEGSYNGGTERQTMKTVTFLGTTQDEAEEKEKHWKSANPYALNQHEMEG